MEVTSSCTYQTYPHTGPNDSGYYVNIPTSHTSFPPLRHKVCENQKFELFSD